MNIENIKVGMRVKISKDISKTHKKFDSNTEMHKMVGGVGEVTYVGSNSIYIQSPFSKYAWTFCPSDVSPPIKTKKPKPVMFDPENIYKGI